MNDWHDLDNLQFEKLGMTRNALFLTIFVAFALYQLVNMITGPYLKDTPGLIQLSPLAGTAAFWWFVMIPQVRKWNEILPRGYFQGLWDYYLFNPQSLEITNDSQPMPLYVRPRAKQQPKRRANQPVTD